MKEVSTAMPSVVKRVWAQKAFELPVAYLVGFALLYVRSFFRDTSFIDVPDAVDSAALVVGLFLLALYVLCYGSLSLAKLVVYGAIAILCVIIYLRSGETNPLVFWALIVAISCVPDRSAALRLWLYVTAAVVAALVVAYGVVALLAPDSLELFYRSSTSTTVRHAFFFNHPNMAGTVVLCLCGAYCSLNYENLRPSHYVAGVVLAGFLYVFTGSRTSTVLVLALLLLVVVGRKTRLFERRKVRRAIGLLPLLLLIGTHLLATVFYSDDLRELLSSRITLWHIAATNGGVTVFGQELTETMYVSTQGWTITSTTVDSLYAQMLYVLGIAFGAVYCLLNWFACTRGGSQYLPFLLVSMVYGVTEVQLVAGTFISCLALVIGITAFERPVEASPAWERLKVRWEARTQGSRNADALSSKQD